jgi:hypothetical protein
MSTSRTTSADRRKIAATRRRRIKAIARSCLFIDTLRATGSDADDFHQRHVTLIRDALERAWHDGFNEALRPAESEGGAP